MNTPGRRPSQNPGGGAPRKSGTIDLLINVDENTINLLKEYIICIIDFILLSRNWSRGNRRLHRTVQMHDGMIAYLQSIKDRINSYRWSEDKSHQQRVYDALLVEKTNMENLAVAFGFTGHNCQVPDLNPISLKSQRKLTF